MVFIGLGIVLFFNCVIYFLFSCCVAFVPFSVLYHELMVMYADYFISSIICLGHCSILLQIADFYVYIDLYYVVNCLKFHIYTFQPTVIFTRQRVFIIIDVKTCKKCSASLIYFI